MRRQEITIFSTSFLDLLSCGMGAVILLCLVFAASKKSTGRVVGETNFFTVSVASPSVPQKPLIRVYVKIAGQTVVPGQTTIEQGTKVSIQPGSPGAEAYQVIVTGQELSSDDRIFVHLYDLNGVDPQAWSKPGSAMSGVKVTSRRVGVGAASENSVTLTLKEPRGSASLKGIEQSGYQTTWEFK